MERQKANKQLIEQFYQYLQERNYRGMQSCYAENSTFYDPVFQDLAAHETKAMWEMLCLRGKDLEVTYRHVIPSEHGCSADWDANYTFGKTGRKVHNKIHAEFNINNGKIVQHKDTFDLYRWSRQALGISGFLLGWTPLLQNKIRKQARNSLMHFMTK